jgi:predicted  nucleic acid-binding Zn-ribbon protein
LEKRVNRLEQLPERMTALESQIVQLRRGMRDEFSAIRQEVRAGDDETRTLMRVLHEDVINRISLIREGRGPSNKKGQKG